MLSSLDGYIRSEMAVSMKHDLHINEEIVILLNEKLICTHLINNYPIIWSLDSCGVVTTFHRQFCDLIVQNNF